MENKKVKEHILRLATALSNACIKTYKDNGCEGCPFKVNMGCNLYGHPIEWQEKLKSVKNKA